MERRYLLGLARAFLSGEAPPRLSADLDWDRLVDLLWRNHVTATLAPLVEREAVPPGVLARMDERVRRLRLRYELIIGEMSGFLPALDEAGLGPVVLKGAALGPTVYADRPVRFFSDVDILSRPSEIDAVVATLGRFGYEPAMGRRVAYYDRYHFHWILKNALGLAVELHWQLTKPSDWVTLDMEGIFERSRSLVVRGFPMRVPCEADQLLHTAIQCHQGGVGDLRRLIDLVLLLRAGAGSDRDLVGRAKAAGLASTLWLLLSVAGRTLGVSVPENLLRDLEPPAAVRRALEHVAIRDEVFDSDRDRGSTQIVRWLCAPSARVAARDAARYVLANRSEIEAGRAAGDGWIPGFFRGVVRLRRTVTVARLAAVEAWLLVNSKGDRREISGRSGPVGPPPRRHSDR